MNHYTLTVNHAASLICSVTGLHQPAELIVRVYVYHALFLPPQQMTIYHWTTEGRINTPMSLSLGPHVSLALVTHLTS